MPESAVVEFLSPEWFDVLCAELNQLALPDSGRAIVLGQVITGVPGSHDEDVRYTISLGGGQPPRVAPGSVEEADVVFVTNYPDALVVATGGASSASLLAAGKVKIRGDARRLVAADGLLAAVRNARPDTQTGEIT
jgi:hypothetical protein